MDAAFVIGQADFGVSQTGALAANLLSVRQGLALDATHHRLFVSDAGNKRVLAFALDDLATGMNAAVVLGASDLNTAGGGPLSATTLGQTAQLAYDNTWKRLL